MHRTSWRAAAVRRFAVAAAIFAGGVVLVVLGDFTVGVIGWAVVGLALVIALALVFLEIGLSEERDRERGR